MRIGLIGHNSVEYIEKLLEIWNSGNSTVLIDYDTPAAVIQHILEECNAKHCYIEKSLCSLCENLTSIEVTLYSVNYKMPCLLPRSIRDTYKSRYDESEAIVINSSGTTGKCKCISLSHRAIHNNADSIIDYMKPSKNDCFIMNKKLIYSSSFTGELLVALKSGADLLLSPVVIPPRLAFQNILNYHVSILCCNPALISMYVAEAERTGVFPRSVKVVYSSGDMISAKEIEKARDTFGCPVYNVYGQTECGPRISAQTEEFCHGNSVGKPIKNVKVQIDSNAEILVKTNAFFSEYIGTPKTQAEWHRTGDLGFIADNGELYVTGRVDNMLVVGAHNIYPETIERVIIDNTDVFDCIVYKKDGRLVCDCVASQDTMSQIIRSVNMFLMPYEVPKSFYLVESITRNKNGKKIRGNGGNC